MTDKRDISRRSALKGIAGTGAIVGGLGFGLAGSASAGDGIDVPFSPERWVDDVVFWKDGSADVVFRKDTPFPVEDLEFTYYNPDLKTKVSATPTITGKETTTRRRFGGRPVYSFSGRVNADNDVVLAFRIGDDRYKPGRRRKRKKKVRSERIDLESRCYTVEHKKDKKKKKKVEERRATFRVENGNKKSVKVSWKELGGKQSGKVTVPKKGSKTFQVDLDDGKTKVALYHEGKKVDVEKANTDKRCKKGH